LNDLIAGPFIILAVELLRWQNLRQDFAWPGDILSNDQTAVAIRRVVHTELEACAKAINQSDKKAALDQLSEASAKLKRLASGLIRQFG
jgi:hypothetical protein